MQILRLQECLSKYERSNDGSTPQVFVILEMIFPYSVKKEQSECLCFLKESSIHMIVDGDGQF